MRLIFNVVGVLLLLVLLAVGVSVWALRRSLPPARESLAVRGLEGPVTLTWDASGVPTVRAGTVNDLAFGQGYAHARDRRFQMELIRRSTAGRLSEVFGALALHSDRENRAFGFRAMADTILPRLDPARRDRYVAYAAGVNAWDASHPAPPEFLALGIPLEPWRPEDFVFVLGSMFRDLQYEGENERAVGAMDAALPRELVDFLTPDATAMDVVLGGGETPAPPPLPTAAVIDLRTPTEAQPRAAARSRRADPEDGLMRGEPARGSNNWAVAASRTRNGRALMCSDPHLGLRVPVIWHRQRLEGPGVAITGITLPGAPDVVMGSNGRVAWSFTNVEGDFLDFVRIEPVATDPLAYAGPDGPERYRERREVIAIKGRAADTLVVRETRWGPVLPGSGAPLAVQWVALDPTACDFDLAEADRAGDLDQLVRAFDGYRGPAFNMVAADANGRIGWRIVGRIPRRAGFDPRRPRSSRAPGAGWDGYLPQDSMPRSLDPTSGFLVTANQRTVGGEAWRRVGSGAAMPWRARRIHDVLAARADWDADASAALQNDVDDALLGATARALDRALTPEAIAGDSTRAAARRLIDAWDHRADTTSVPHAYLRHARVALHEMLIDPLVAPCRAADSTFFYSWSAEDEVVRRLLDERPAHLLDPRFPDYDALALAAADSGAARLRRRAPGVPLERIHWGYVNRARIRHPLGGAIPALAPWLNMPDAALAGGASIVRVARPASGASMRMIVELGGESRFALPGGQSGHFLSRHYGDGFADWVAGRYGALEPGASLAESRLTPR